MAPPPLSFAYHGIADVPLQDDPDNLFVRPRDLTRHLRLLRRWGYRTVTFGEQVGLVERGQADGTVSLTFDDGYVDNLETLVPLLDEHGATATVFVVPGFYGRPHPDAPWARCLTAAEVVELGTRVEIGSHTVTHRDLRGLSTDEQREELVASRGELEGLLQRPVDLLAYPFGGATHETVHLAREAGYRAACLTCGEGSWGEPLRLPRLAMDNGMSRVGLELRRRGLYNQVTAHLPARALRRGQRLLRRHLRPLAERAGRAGLPRP